MEDSISGLTEEQAKEFHEQFKVVFTTFMVLAAAAHFLVYIWRPWF
ncbi:light-harvesting protein [Ectothiorhodospira haloalkaliphila]|nr:light-harvesting antenna LH1, beta subunit [Ectothiorhodospira haloalkaliphila]MCG5524758.1 light-harvesting protein [Ectothiorhodospira haloalkaliphila]